MNVFAGKNTFNDEKSIEKSFPWQSLHKYMNILLYFYLYITIEYRSHVNDWMFLIVHPHRNPISWASVYLYLKTFHNKHQCHWDNVLALSPSNHFIYTCKFKIYRHKQKHQHISTIKRCDWMVCNSYKYSMKLL